MVAERDEHDSLRVLFDVVHPADVHFFRGVMERLVASGHAVAVASRHKDVAVPLLHALGISHSPISTHRPGRVCLATELAVRSLRLTRLARRFHPTVLVANNSPCASLVGAMLRVPSVVFDDTEIHGLSQMLYLPFVSEVHSPEGYRKSLGHKQQTYPGLHALAYLRPPQPPRPPEDRVGPAEIFVRFVSWGAAHDRGAPRLDQKQTRELIAGLQRLGALTISSESRLPPSLSALRFTGKVDQVHSALQRSDLVVTESATMASEAAVLGTPAILVDGFGRGYTDVLEKFGLCFRAPPDGARRILEIAAELLGTGRATFHERRKRLLETSIDVMAYQERAIVRGARAS